MALDSGVESSRDSVLEATNAVGIMTRPVWTLMHELSPFKGSPQMNLDVTRSLSQRLINIPSSE